MLEHEFITTIFQFFEASETTMHQLMSGAKPKQLSNLRYKILEYLYFNKQSDISGLADCLYLSLPNASREIRILLEQGYICKEKDEKDRRRFFLKLSEKGSEIMAQVLAKAIANAEIRYGQLSSRKQMEITAAMQKVIAEFLSADGTLGHNT